MLRDSSHTKFYYQSMKDSNRFGSPLWYSGNLRSGPIWVVLIHSPRRNVIFKAKRK